MERDDDTAIVPAKLARFTLSFGIRLFLGCLLLATVLPGRAADRQNIPYRLTPEMTNAKQVAPGMGWQRLNIAIGLPLRNQDALNQLLKEINDPASPNYHHYLTPEQFTERFGPTREDYEAVVHWAQTHGFTVTGRHANRMLLDLKGMSVNIEQALHVKLRVYQHPTENRTFYAPDRAPSIDLNVPVSSISGLDNFELPHPMLYRETQTNGVNGATPASGSAPSGNYMGSDFRAAYVPGVAQTGIGQTVGLLEFDSGYYTSDILRYESAAGLPNVPVQAVLLDGYNGGAGGGNDEVSLDIEMAISMAPGLSQVLVYEGSTTDDILNRMATDNVAKQIGASWTYPIDATSDQIFKEFAAQGQSFFNASGDSDAYTGTIPTPSDDTNIICVGGTTLTTTGPAGAWVSETVWNWGGGTGSSGGISTVNAIPSWQMGINMTANQGSTTMRNIPDVAMVADEVWVDYGNGQSGSFGGTSCATPLWAGFTALANQLALANGETLVGFINPAVYAIGKGSNNLSYTTLFHDITTGNNESPKSPDRFSAVPGYDLCTGWGTPAGSNLLTALALPEPLRITPGSVIVSGPVGGPFSPTTITYSLTNKAAGSLNWSLANASSLWSVSPVNGTLVAGGPSATVTANLSAAASGLAAGSYLAPLQFTNLSDGFGQTRLITLAVVTPPVITAQPINQAVLVGTSASFSVSTGTNALLYYQWRENGANLTDKGNIFGSATSTLTVSNVSYASAGTFSVIVSNAAGVALSSNALLTIVPSPPVIVQQPTNQIVLPGAPATFSVAAIGDTPYSYYWQFNGTNLANSVNVGGVTTSFLTISNVYPANAGLYSVIVSNSLGWTTSTGAMLSVISVTAPGVALQPLWSFTGGSDGAYLYSPLTQWGSSGYFLGAAIEGGTYGDGTVFRANTNGTVISTVSFDYTDGAIPYAGLLFSTNSFYGANYLGGNYGDGTLFRTSVGGGLTTLVTFNGQNGELPVAGMTQGTDGNFYGTTLEGGDYGDGTVFKMSPAGVLTILVSFNGADGADPSGVLVQGADGNFYGTTELGGAFDDGAIFKVSPSGQFSLLYSFTFGTDGAEPIPGLTLGVDGNFYGNTITGGSGGYGTIFQLTPSGTLNTLYSFTDGADGGNPWGGLMQASDGNLYGTCQEGGTYGYGTVFRISPTGPLVPLVQFDGYEGANPSAAIVQGTDGNLYGTTLEGGSDGYGAIFKLSIGGALQITGQPADQSVYLGGTALFTVATFGSSPVFYQWQRDGTNLINGGNISGANTATLSVSNVTVNDVALYSVVVSNSFNSVASDYAVLEVIYSPPNITSQPVSLVRVTGATASFSVTATGDPPLSYQWQENGNNLVDGGNISGSASSTLTISGVTSANAGTYSVIVSNPLYTVSSSPATLTVIPATAPSASFTQLRLFNGGPQGGFPYAGLIQGHDGNLWGTTVEGGSDFAGTIFRWNLSTGLTTFYSFSDGNDGGEPYGRLVQSSAGYFYSTTFEGGSNGYGAVIRMTTTGVVLPIASFTGGTDGGDPYSGLIQGADGNLYGTTAEGGANSYGTVYKMGPNGGLTGLYEFTDGNDGGYPYAGLIQGADGGLYGTTLEGGTSGYGTVFRVTTNGTLTTLISFNYANGSYPVGGVIQGADGRLYGTTAEGGTNGYGTVFSLSTNGTLTTLYSFNSTNGADPEGALLQANDGNFYGTTLSGGLGGQGTVFKLTTNGVLTTLLWFDGFNGANPQGTIIQASNGYLYGTTPFGGTGYNPSAGGGYGTIFQLIVPVFITNSFTVPTAIGNLPYAATIAGAAIAPAGDPLSFAKVSGPAWLMVGANGVLSGTPPNSNIGTNVFVVSLTDSNGVSASATLKIAVTQDPPPSFVLNPFTEPWANVDEDYSGTIASNAFDLELTNGDVLTFAKVSGPAWLTVAADGTLSGTPEGTDAGSNTFLVSVVNLGGLSNTATMFVYVSSPPYFAPSDFAKVAATVGLPYSDTIATNAIDPDTGAGDVLTFYKVTGPAWLNVATNGALSGTPAASDVGTGDYLMLVVDSGDLAGVGTMSLTVNTDAPPVFASNPFTEPSAIAAQAYSGTIANVSDPDFGDSITLAKVSGPAWLSVASNGALSGTPGASDAGTNSFVVSATDLEGVSSQATMFINVSGPINLAICCSGGQLNLSWTGGNPPYQVQMKTSVGTGWSNVGAPTSSTNLVLTPSNSAVYFRVQGQ